MLRSLRRYWVVIWVYAITGILVMYHVRTLCVSSLFRTVFGRLHRRRALCLYSIICSWNSWRSVRLYGTLRKQLFKFIFQDSWYAWITSACMLKYRYFNIFRSWNLCVLLNVSMYYDYVPLGVSIFVLFPPGNTAVSLATR